MIGIPKALAAAGFHSPMIQQQHARIAACVSNTAIDRDRIYSAGGTNSTIALQHFLAKIGRLRTQLPFMNAILRAERIPATGNLERTPPADPAPIRTARYCPAINPSSGHCATSAHASLLQWPGPIAYSFADSPRAEAQTRRRLGKAHRKQSSPAASRKTLNIFAGI